MAIDQEKGISGLEDRSRLDKIRDFMAEVAQSKTRASEAKQEAMQSIQPTAAQTAYIGSIFAPGAGTIDAAGNFPAFPGSDVALQDAFSGEPMPSMAENIKAGGIDRYLMAPLQGLGVAGDAAYGIPVAGPGIAAALKLPAALATVAGGIAKASKAKKITKLKTDETKQLFSGIESTQRKSLDEYNNPILDLVNKRPELKKLSQEAIPSKDGIVSLFRVYNIGEGNKLLPEAGVASLSTDITPVMKIGSNMEYKSSGGFSPMSLGKEQPLQELIRPAQIVRYDVPVDRIQAHIPSLIDSLPSNVKKAQKNESYILTGQKEKEVLADLSGIEPAAVFDMPYQSPTTYFKGDRTIGRGEELPNLGVFELFEQGKTPKGIMKDIMKSGSPDKRKFARKNDYKKYSTYLDEVKADELNPSVSAPIVQGGGTDFQKANPGTSPYQLYGPETYPMPLASRSVAKEDFANLNKLYNDFSVLQGTRSMKPDVPVFPAPERMFDPANKSFNPSLSDFKPIPGGRYLQMGKDKTDITGQVTSTGKISVGPNGKPSFVVSTSQLNKLPEEGKIIRTNLFKKKAGWKWTKAPEGYDPNPASDFPIVSLETGGKHHYTLSTDFENAVELRSYPNKSSEPKLRPTARGEIDLGVVVGEISVRGKIHPVYDQITATSAIPPGQ